jgi:hypothetical protein
LRAVVGLGLQQVSDPVQGQELEVVFWEDSTGVGLEGSTGRIFSGDYSAEPRTEIQEEVLQEKESIGRGLEAELRGEMGSMNESHSGGPWGCAHNVGRS